MDREILEVLKSMQSDIKSMQSELKKVNERVGKVEDKTDKNTLLLENLDKKVQIVGGVQSALKEQLDRTIILGNAGQQLCIFCI